MPDSSPPSIAANPLATLLATLRRTTLLPANQLEEIEKRPEAQGTDPKPLGRVLFHQGWLTRYQLNQLAAGRDDQLVIGPYVLLEKIAEGGGGQVFKARHRVMNRIVALKRIHGAKIARPDLVQRFFQEAQVAAQLDHPNVVRAYDAGQVGSTCFLVMEFVDGVDLTRLVREGGPLGVAQACDYMRQAALGLQHAHERGLVHCDIKPSNLLVAPIDRSKGGLRVGPNAVVKLLDLGLARWHTDDSPVESGPSMGSPYFIAPEQIRNGNAVDIRSDLYSLGCTWFFVLTGQPPFEGSRSELLQCHFAKDAPRVESVRPGIPKSISDVVCRLMRKVPNDRFKTPAELVAEIAKIVVNLSADRPAVPKSPQPAPKPPSSGGLVFADESGTGDEIAISTPSLKPSVSRGKRTTKKTLALFFGIGLHVIAAGIVVVVLMRKHSHSNESPNDGKNEAKVITKVTDRTDKTDNAVFEPKKRDDNVLMNPVKAKALPKAPVRFAKGPTTKNKEAIDLIRLFPALPNVSPKFPAKPPIIIGLPEAPKGTVTGLAIVPDHNGPLLASTSQVQLLDPTTGRVRSSIGDQALERIEVSPNGVFAAGLVTRQVQYWLIDPPTLQWTLPISEGATCWTHTPNGNYLLVGGTDGRALLFDLVKREVERTLDVGEPITAVAVAPNGWLAAVGTERGQIVLFDMESQAKLGTTTRHAAAVRAFGFSPDQKLIATASDDGKVHIASAETGEPRETVILDQPLHELSFVGNDWCVAGSRGSKMFCFDILSRNAISYGDEKMGSFQAFALSFDRRSIFAAFSQLGIGRIDLEPPP